jgi:hypothetical protein
VRHRGDRSADVLRILLCACSPLGGSLEDEIKEYYAAVADSPAAEQMEADLESVTCKHSDISLEGTTFDDAHTCELVFDSGSRTFCVYSRGSHKMYAMRTGRCTTR